MGLEESFAVATEFRFDVGEALLNTKALQGAVDNLSQSANSALTSLSYLASGLVAKLGFGSGGVLSILTKSVQVSEAFNTSALELVNNMQMNMNVLSNKFDTFNQKLATSQMILDDISKTAITFGVNTGELSRITQLISTPLAMRGMLGKNYANAINMSKNLLIGAEAVGLHPQVASESLYRALTEHMPLHGALFARLLNTRAFKEARIGTQQQLQVLNQDKKIELLNQALEQLGGDAEFVSNRLKSIRVQFEILKNQIEVVLRPIGEAIVRPLRTILAAVNDYIRRHGKDLGKNLAALIDSIFGDPKALFVNLMQLKEFGRDFHRAVNWASIITTLMLVKRLLEHIGITFGGGLIRRVFAFLLDGLVFFGRMIGPVITGILRFLTPVIGEFVSVFAPLLFFFQIFSRAKGIAKLRDAEALANLLPKLSERFTHLKEAISRFFLPLTMAINFWAELLAPLFQSAFYLELLIPLIDGITFIFEALGDTFVILLSVVSGVVMAIIGLVDDLINMKNPFANIKENFTSGMQDFLHAHGMGMEANKAVVNQVTNVGKIEARFDMREQLEPDRIAFAVTTHLKRLATNPTQGRGQAFAAGIVNPAFGNNGQ